MHPLPNNIIASIDFLNLKIDWDSLKRNEFQGFMSDVYTLNARDWARYICHKIFINGEHTRRNFPESLKALSDSFTRWILKKTPHYYFIELHDGYLYTLQKHIRGIPSGKRILRDGKIIDSYSPSITEHYQEELLRFLANLHELPVLGSGPYRMWEQEILTWTHSSWKDFIFDSIEFWIEESHLDGKQEKFIRELLETITWSSNNTLLHGDITNPSNILIGNDNSIAWVIDWEWSLIWDAAWEFANLWWRELLKSPMSNIYFRKRRFSTEEQSLFIEKVKKYHILWLLWWTSLHSRDREKNLFQVLRQYLKLAIIKFLESANEKNLH